MKAHCLGCSGNGAFEKEKIAELYLNGDISTEYLTEKGQQQRASYWQLQKVVEP